MRNHYKLVLGTAALAVVALVFPPVSRADTVVVTTMSETGWFGLNEGPSSSIGETLFTPGPGTPPAGVGSATLEVDDTGRASFGTMQFKGVPLASITELTFSEYVSSALVPSSATLQLEVDYDATDTDTVYQGRLVSLPAGPPTLDTWVARNPLAGTWWATKSPGLDVCPQSAPCTWAEVLAAFPNASVRNDLIGGGAVLFRLGGPITGGAQVSVDDFTLGRGLLTTTVDFEPGASVTPSVGPAGSQITIQAYGFRPLKNGRVFYYTNMPTHRRLKICRARTSLSGAFLCSVNLPAEPDAGPTGVHDVRIVGPRKIDYTTAFYLAQP